MSCSGLQRMRGNALAWLCALAGMALATVTARADEATASPSFAVSIRSESGLSLPVAFRRSDAEHSAPPVAECTTPCSLALPRAEYRVEVQGGTDGTLRSKLALDYPTQLSVTRGDKVAKAVGLALGITGPVMLGFGLPILILTTAFGQCTAENPVCPSSLIYASASLTAAGAIATPAGWILYANNRVRIKDVTQPTSAEGPTFAVVPVRGGVGLSGGFAF